MSGTHFYLTLPSNASLDVFPDNKTTEYRVNYHNPLIWMVIGKSDCITFPTRTPGILYEILLWTRTSITLKALDGLRWQP